jgi:hypothetical protein
MFDDMSAEYSRPRPVIEFMLHGELKVRAKKSREVVQFLRKIDSVVKVDDRGGGVIHFYSKDPSLSLLVSRKFKRDFIQYRTLQMKTSENY